MKISNYLRAFFSLLLISLGFFAGVSWKNSDNSEVPKDTTETVSPAAPTATPSNLPSTREALPRKGLTKEEGATIRLFEEASPSVCFITTSNLRRDYFNRNATEVPSGSGSGFVWDKKGHIVTNYHVIQRADRAKVSMSDQTVWDAKLVGIAPDKDLAVLRIEAPAKDLQPIPVGTSEDLKVGQSVYAIGNPFGLDYTLTTGIVSALGREIQSVSGIPIRDAIQTDAAINPGNSGGPLLDSSGRLIGVNTSIYSPSGASAGIGFSIPSDIVSWVVPELIEFGELKRPTIGIQLAPPNTARRLNLEGVLVIGVIKDSAAERAGIQPTYRDRSGRIRIGDVIVALNGEKVKSQNDLFLALEKYEAGDQVNITVRRVEEEKEVELALTLDPPNN